MAKYTLSLAECAELLITLDQRIPSDDAVEILRAAYNLGCYKGPVGRYLARVDHAGEKRFTVTIESMRAEGRF